MVIETQPLSVTSGSLLSNDTHKVWSPWWPVATCTREPGLVLYTTATAAQHIPTTDAHKKQHPKTISVTALCSALSYQGDLNTIVKDQYVFDWERVSSFQLEVFLGSGSAPSFLNLRPNINSKEKNAHHGWTQRRREGGKDKHLAVASGKKAKCGLLAGGRVWFYKQRQAGEMRWFSSRTMHPSTWRSNPGWPSWLRTLDNFF